MKLAAIIFISSFAFAFAALPPGYEDKLLCPCNFCQRKKQQNPYNFIAGPRSMFRECQNNAGVVIAVTPWGSKSSTAKKLDELHGLGYHELHCESSVIAKYACNNEVTTSAEALRPVTTTISTVCPKCVINEKSRERSCCAPGGAWANNCGNVGDSKFDHTWAEGRQACETASSPPNARAISPACPKCVINNKSGKRSCCAPGGAWANNCGDVGDSKFEHTWAEGLEACFPTSTATSPPMTTMINPICLKCGINKQTGKRNCCAPGGSWANDCGDPGNSNFGHTWFEGLEACEMVPSPPITTAISPVCPKCGTNKKSGKRSCCAPGGAWANNCGDVGDSQFGHTWVEGLRACETFMTPRITTATSPVCPKCGTIRKSGKYSCCAPNGAWAKICGNPGDSKFAHTWTEGLQTCETFVADTCLKCVQVGKSWQNRKCNPTKDCIHDTPCMQTKKDCWGWRNRGKAQNAQQTNAAQQQTIESDTGRSSVNHTVVVNGQRYNNITNITSCICLLLTTLFTHMF